MTGYADFVTAVFTPDPTCFASSNLWLPQTTRGCGTYPFNPQPTETVKLSECGFPRLGPPPSAIRDPYDSCYQSSLSKSMPTAYSDCPIGMTPAAVDTHRFSSGTTVLFTTCCPNAYDFKADDGTPTPVPFVVGGTTYSGTFKTYDQCKATSIKAFSDQVVTVTLATSPLSTTETTWDYEQGFLVAEPASIIQHLYPDEEAGTTATCFGHHCPALMRNSQSVPTSAPTRSYIPPPSPVVTRFTPAPSCLSDDNLWIVSASCYLPDARSLFSPSWLQCTYTNAGEPNPSNTACYQRDTSTVVSGTTAFYSACPPGYTTAWEGTRQAYSSLPHDANTSNSYDVYRTEKACCPSGIGGDISFSYTQVATTQTRGQNVFIYVVPWCAASSVSQFRDRTVTMGLYNDTRIWDKKKRQGAEYSSTTAVWDVENDLLYANVQTLQWIVFHSTYTCYESCSQYFTSSYYNTDPNYTPSPTSAEVTTGGTTAATAEEGMETSASTSSSTAAAAAMVRGDVQVGRLSVVMVIVTVVQVVVGALA